MMSLWLVAFALTVAIEAPVVWFLVGPAEPRPMRKIGAIFYANLATHPAVWFIFPLLPVSRGTSLALSEISAFVLEAALYAMLFDKISLRRAALVSLLANGLSLSVGCWALPAIAGWLRQ
jgi:hypothetical protein